MNNLNRGIIIRAKNNLVVVLICGLFLGAASTAIVQAAIPDTGSGKIHGCYKTGLLNKGQLRVIDSATTSCGTGEASITWNEASPGNFVNDLTNADFSGADIRYRNFSGTDLRDVVFVGANANGASFANSDLSGANLSSFAALSLKFSGAKLKNITSDSATNLQHANYTGVDFTGRNLQGAWDNSNYTNALMSGLVLNGTTMSASNMSGTNFTNAHFTNVALQYSTMDTANLSGVVWTNTVCPDTTNSDANGGTCIGHLVP